MLEVVEGSAAASKVARELVAISVLKIEQAEAWVAALEPGMAPQADLVEGEVWAVVDLVERELVEGSVMAREVGRFGWGMGGVGGGFGSGASSGHGTGEGR